MTLTNKLIDGTIDPLVLAAALDEWAAGEDIRQAIINHWVLTVREGTELDALKIIYLMTKGDQGEFIDIFRRMIDLAERPAAEIL